MVAEFNLKHALQMAEENLKAFTNSTLIPFSLVTAALTMVVAIVIAFISMRKDVEFNAKSINVQNARFEKMEAEYIKKNELILELQKIQLELSNIKEKIKK